MLAVSQFSIARSALLTVAALIAIPVSAQSDDAQAAEVLGLINTYRNEPQTCDGKKFRIAGPLAPDATLARVNVSADTQLQDALKEAGYAAARAQAISVSGPSNASDAINFIKQRYCSLLLNPQYSAVGISQEGNTWRLVFARPLLSANLGDWRQAGKEVLKHVNAARRSARNCGRQQFRAARPLAWNDKLAAASHAHSRDMANNNYFSHQGKDGGDAARRATRAGYAWRRIGENIAAGQGSSKEAVAGWLSSPGHCANLMNPAFAEMGAAFAVNAESDTMIYWTQVFGTPR